MRRSIDLQETGGKESSCEAALLCTSVLTSSGPESNGESC